MSENELVMVWKDEPDEVYFEYKGHKCAIYRHQSLGHLCGYVGMKKIEDFDEHSVGVHGGVTYFVEAENVFDEMKEYFSDDDYVIGFDTAHFDDLVPSMANMGLGILSGGTYKDVFYVKKEIEGMVDQLQNRIMENEWK